MVVNFWASWCVECRREQPTLVAAANAYGPSGVVFVGIDYQDDRGSADAFLNELGRGSSSYYRYVTDPGSQAAVDFGVFGVPETFILNRGGVIVAKITGAAGPPLLARTLEGAVAGRQPGFVVGGRTFSAPGKGTAGG